MTPIRQRVRHHPVATYLALTTTSSWGWILLLAGGVRHRVSSAHPLRSRAREMVAWYLVWAALLWAVVAILALARRRTGEGTQQVAARGQLEGPEAVPTRVPSMQGAARG